MSSPHAAAVILRLEQLYPFPADLLQRLINRYPRAKDDIVWVQEESQNMGAWFFVEPRLRELGYAVRYVGRDASASPATGSKLVHDHEQAELVEAAIGAEVPHLVAAHPARSLAKTPARQGVH